MTLHFFLDLARDQVADIQIISQKEFCAKLIIGLITQWVWDLYRPVNHIFIFLSFRSLSLSFFLSFFHSYFLDCSKQFFKTGFIYICANSSISLCIFYKLQIIATPTKVDNPVMTLYDMKSTKLFLYSLLWSFSFFFVWPFSPNEFFFVGQLHGGCPIEENPGDLTILLSQYFTTNSIIALVILVNSTQCATQCGCVDNPINTAIFGAFQFCSLWFMIFISLLYIGSVLQCLFIAFLPLIASLLP